MVASVTLEHVFKHPIEIVSRMHLNKVMCLDLLIQPALRLPLKLAHHDHRVRYAPSNLGIILCDS